MAAHPLLIDTVAWAVKNGFRHFKRLHITADGLFATKKIPQYDFVCLTGAENSLSVHTVQRDTSFPLGVTFNNYGQELPWWNDLNWGSFALVCYLARAKLSGEGGMASYLQLQCPEDCDTSIGRHGAECQRRPEYIEVSARALQLAKGKSREEFDAAVLQCYCLTKTLGLPMWSAEGQGHPFFGESPFVLGKDPAASGDVTALVPCFDFARHSARPNAAIGHLDQDMIAWLRQERDVPPSEHFFAMQALQDIQPGEPVTVDRNVNYQFDPDTFHAWFGYPYDRR